MINLLLRLTHIIYRRNMKKNGLLSTKPLKNSNKLFMCQPEKRNQYYKERQINAVEFQDMNR